MKFIDEIKCDLYRYTGSYSLLSFIKAIRYPGFVYFVFFRLTSNQKVLSPLWLLGRFFIWLFSYRFGFQIPAKTDIGSGVMIAHFGMIIINSEVKIGRNCNISPNVVIGQTNRGKRNGVPEIGNSVWVGTGAVLVGKIKIGNNVLIAPNSYVNFDIPSNSIVIGSPIRIIEKEDATAGYITNVN